MKGGLSNFRIKGDNEQEIIRNDQNDLFENKKNDENGDFANNKILFSNIEKKCDEEINPKYKFYLYVLLFFLGRWLIETNFRHSEQSFLFNYFEFFRRFSQRIQPRKTNGHALRVNGVSECDRKDLLQQIRSEIQTQKQNVECDYHVGHCYFNYVFGQIGLILRSGSYFLLVDWFGNKHG